MEQTTIPGLDMTVVTSETVAQALPNLLTEWRMRKRWSDFSWAARNLHQHILQCFLDTGTTPKTSALDQALLFDLQERDLIVMDGDRITAAYPFSDTPTRHAVQIDGRKIACVCMIDALGVGAMVGEPTHVTSRCPVCEQEIYVGIGRDGVSVASTDPPTTRIWAGIVPIDGCAANSQCQSMLAFCGPQHLAEWQAQDATRQTGYAFTAAQAVQAGAAIFRPFLAGKERTVPQ